MPPRKKNAAIKLSGATSSKAAPLPDWVKGGGAKPPPPTGTNRDGTAQLFPPRYKTPLNLMYERIQKLPGWLKPEVEPIQRKEGYTCVVTLRKENKQDRSNPHTVRMEPKEPGARLQCETSLHAKHWGATYVLFRLFNQLGLHRVLPPGPREYWLELEQVKAQAPESDSWKWASDPFEAIAKRDAEAAAREKARAAREASKSEPAPLSKAWQRAPEVRMAPALRELVESTIRARLSDAVPSVDALDHGLQQMSLDKPALEKELLRLGVRAAYIRRVLAWLEEARAKYASPDALEQLRSMHPLLASILALPNREAAIEYMVLFTPEQDLPPKLRPTASSDSFVTGAASGGVSQEALVDRWTIDKLSRCAGFPRENIARALDMVRRAGLGEPQAAREGAVLDLLLHELVGDAEPVLSTCADHVAQKRDDERTMLTACLGDDVVRRVPDNDAIDDSDFDIFLGTFEKEDVSLRVSLHAASHYLSKAGAWPSIYVTSSTLPSFLRLALTRHALQSLARRADIRDALEANEGGVLFLVVEELKECIPAVLHDPPALSDVMEHLVDRAPNTAARAIQQTERARPRAARTPRRARPLARQEALDASMRASRDAWHASPTFLEQVRPVRESLPAHAAREMVLESVRTHRVVLIAGETGCGKTTQVPQFLLDDAIEQGCGSLCSIVVTQPRRVSAMGVAARVAAERGESLDGAVADDAVVGYAIRGERRASRSCRLLFTTTGVLLRRMATGADADLASLSHIIVDEVHERSIDSDFLLLLLRRVLERNPTLRVVLMSATIQADTFTRYFGGAPYLEIPGRTYPVQTHYLEQLVQATGYRTPVALTRDDERADKLYDAGALDADAVPTVRALVASSRTDYGLLAATVAYAAQCAAKIDGTGSLRGRAAILVFCPGVGEIRQAMDAISALPIQSELAVLPLHANLPPNEQHRVFQPVGRTQRKVVVATNVAETSITIPEVCYVIDTGRVREAQYDARAGVSRLLDTWASRAASRQRAGRAGRTMAGECFRLYSRAMESELQAAHSAPEMQRTPLEGVVLQVKAIQPDANVRTFLGEAIDPPSLEALDAAHTRLVVAGALHTDGGHAARLTPLGRHVAMLPLDVRQAKLLVYACLFGCVEPLLHLAALVSSRPIVASAAARDEAAAQARAQSFLGHSDLLTHAHLFAQWLTMRAERRPGSDVRAFCDKHGLSALALQEAALTRTTLLQQLEETGLVDRAYVQGYRAQGPAWPARASSLAYDMHSRHTNLLRSLLLAALWPSMARVDQPAARYHASASGAVRKEAHARELHYFDEHDGRVFLHPSSLLFHATECQSGYVAFLSKSARGPAGEARTYLRDITEVPLYALLLFGGPLHVDHEVGGVLVSTGAVASAHAWVRLRANPRIGVLCRQLRQLIDRMLEEGIEDPRALVAPHHEPIVQAMLALVQHDGLAAP